MGKDRQEQLSDILGLLYNIDDNQVMIYRELRSIHDDLETIKKHLQLAETHKEQQTP